jgi:hypothetical protein
VSSIPPLAQLYPGLEKNLRAASSFSACLRPWGDQQEEIMKITAMTTALVMGAALYAEPVEKSVTVCMERGSGIGAGLEARAIASKMFATIGVTVSWHTGLDHCPPQALKVSLSQTTPKSERPGAYGYALPYEGTHIVVYYDRISQEQSKTAVPNVVAHVLVHEITHILEGMVRHSDAGIMKAHWDDRDFTDMFWKPLKFAQVDIDLIYSGLEGRAARTTAAMNRADTAVAAHQPEKYH